MDETVGFNLCLANINNLGPERLVVYIWLKYMCELHNNQYQVDYKIMTTISGLPMKKISAGIRHLESKRLIDVSRGRKVTISILAIPDEYQDYLLSQFAEAAHVQRMRALANPIPVESILDNSEKTKRKR